MLRIKTTPNLYGISLQGDYTDLNELYDSLARYLEFYEVNTPTFSYHEYEYMLSLNYDIRHAYMGSRDYESVENNASEVGVIAEAMYQISDEAKSEFHNAQTDFSAGNLYFSVNILYPLVFHYLISLETILDDYTLPDENAKLPDYRDEYPMIQANYDQAQIRLLTALLWDNLNECLGKKTALMFYRFYSEKEYILTVPPIYIDGLLHFQEVHFKENAAEIRKAILIASLFEIMGTEELKESPEEFREGNAVYRDALRLLKKSNIDFPTKNAFFDALEKKVPTGQPLYRDTFEQFLNEEFGIMQNEYEEPDW